jgi:hypothetical protein
MGWIRSYSPARVLLLESNILRLKRVEVVKFGLEEYNSGRRVELIEHWIGSQLSYYRSRMVRKFVW